MDCASDSICMSCCQRVVSAVWALQSCVRCAVACAGTMGLKGDLTAGEIVEQLVHARKVTTIKNVVYMVRRLPIHV